MLHQQQWAKRLTQAVVAASALIGLAWGSQSVVHASTLAIPDISEWQGKLTSSQVANLKSQVSFVINRTDRRTKIYMRLIIRRFT